MFRLINTECVVVNTEWVNDPFGGGYCHYTYAQKRTLNLKAVAFYAAIMLTIIGIIVGALMFTGSNAETTTTSTVAETSTTMVTETSTTTAPAEEGVLIIIDVPTMAEETTTTTVEEIIPSYVCDMVVDSDVYAFQEYFLEDGTQLNIPWADMTKKNIVFQFNLDMMYFEDFSDDVEMFNQYTGMDIRVEDSTYVGMDDEFIVPVNMGILEEDVWAQMGVGVSASSFLGVMSVSFPSAELTVDEDALGANWEYHNHIMLHEFGHLFGLDHTMHLEGDETSIMSYNSDYESIGLLPGDIAGLQEVFCN